MTIVYVLLVIVMLLLIVLIVRSRYGNDEVLMNLKYKLDVLGNEVGRIESSLKNEIASNRNESSKTAKDARDEMANSLKTFGELITSTTKSTSELQRGQLQTFSDNLGTLTKSVDDKLRETTEINSKNLSEGRRELKEALETMRFTIEKKVTEMQAANEKKLDEMRATVDEKLQTTLETRLGESFKLVSERLEAVHKGLGDMQQLATGVGDLKKVLTNVKTRGVLGEYQLANLLEQLFTPDQYSRNVKTKKDQMVRLNLPSKCREGKMTITWLPIDSKFPKEDFELLMNAYENGNNDLIEESRRSFVRGIKKSAMDICVKYIDPPNTTDFAILFLPFESLYAEVLRTPGLFESIQRECKINIAGPTTLSAFLSSLQMGFRTLAIERRTSEVWQLLGAVKTQFGHFGTILEKTQKKLIEANNVMEEAGRRSRAIERRLKSVQDIPHDESLLLLNEMSEIIDPEDES